MNRPSSTSSSKRWVTRSFVAVVVAFVAIEIVARVLFVDTLSGRFDYGYHPDAGFVESGDTLSLVRAGGRRFRPQSMPVSKPVDSYRVFTVGDSVPRGSSLESAYPALLNQLLVVRGRTVASYNMGVPGFGVRRIQVMLKRAMDYRPDLVILHLYDSNEFEDEREWRRAQEFDSWHPRNWPMKSVVLRRLYELKTEKVFWRWLPVEIRNQRGVSDAGAELEAGVDQRLAAEWRERVIRVSGENLATIRDGGAAALVVVQARYDRATNRLQPIEALERLADRLETQGVSVVRMSEVVAGETLAEIFKDGSHLHARGHALLAAAIARKVQATLAAPTAAD